MKNRSERRQDVRNVRKSAKEAENGAASGQPDGQATRAVMLGGQQFTEAATHLMRTGDGKPLVEVILWQIENVHKAQAGSSFLPVGLVVNIQEAAQPKSNIVTAPSGSIPPFRPKG